MFQAEVDKINLTDLSLTDKQLKEYLKSSGRIKENDIEFATILFRKLFTNQGQEDIAIMLLGNENNAPEIKRNLEPLHVLLQVNTIPELVYLLRHNITGQNFYSLWKGCGTEYSLWSGKQNNKSDLFLLNIWALMSGVYTKEEIINNFTINGIIEPFVYSQEFIDLVGFIVEEKNLNPYSNEFKRFVQANKKLHLMFRFLKNSELIAEDFRFNSKDEIIIFIKMPFIENTFQGITVRQMKNDPVESFVINSDQVSQLIGLRQASKFFNEASRLDLCKALYFLKYSKRQFLPSLAVIRSMPVENISNFYINNNNKRYGEIIEKGGYTTKEEQIGIFKLAYILGLFSESENESKTAEMYIKNYIISRVNKENIYNLYGTIELFTELNREFAEFFMIHHSKNVHCFEGLDGQDKAGQIYLKFKQILANRMEKKIKTTTNRERLMPDDAINMLEDTCFLLNIDSKYKEYVDVISKYTSERDAILWIIEQLESTKLIPQEVITIPNIIDDSNSSCKFRLLKKGDPEIAITGLKTNCCFKYGGVAQHSLMHAITNPDSSVVVFESEKGYAQGWIWYDEKNQVLVIDNIEGVCESDIGSKKTYNTFIQAVFRFADQILKEMNIQGNICSSVNLGMGWMNNSLVKTLEIYQAQGLLKKCKNPPIEYITKRNLYSDAHEQFVVSDAELIKKRAEKYETEKSNDG